jgi:hypothetical protein
MTAHLSGRQVAFAENGQKPTSDVAVCESASESLPVRPPAGPIARVEGGKFAPGRSANPGGKAAGERALLQRMYGRDGKKVFRRLEELRNDPKTPKRLQMQIDFFIVERLFGKAPLPVGIESGPSLLSLLAEVAARRATAPPQEAP